ncbi:MAG: hypothetical protein NTY74_16405 [Ignavibacteriae bacterium]|nr:hypothetical protein [Ignavibacteriota bacterium]
MKVSVEHMERVIELSSKLTSAANTIEYLYGIIDEVKKFFIDAKITDIKKNKGLLIFERTKLVYYKQKQITDITLEEVDLLIEIIKVSNTVRTNESPFVIGVDCDYWEKRVGKGISPDTFKIKVHRLKHRDKILRSIIRYRDRKAILVNGLNIPINIA